ncbi:MAG TPA: efflux RND transporter periplasmic adaptor subunit [Polyangiales bacterium]|nr:efflux RND transporter periplasmic adaptor subunit [Polyangiales bacterium]
MKAKRVFLALAVLGGATVFYLTTRARSDELVLTGIVTTDPVHVSPQIGGRIERLLVKEGDRVERGQVLALLAAGELQAEREYFAHSAESSENLLQESEAALRYQEQLANQQLKEAEATLAATQAQLAESKANQDNTRRKLERDESVARTGGLSAQAVDESRNALSVSEARTQALERRVEAQRAAVGLARSAEQQVLAKRSASSSARRQLAAARAQSDKADVRLGYTELHAPVSGLVDVRVAREGEVVSMGQPVVSLLDPDDLWVRADVEESYIDRVRLGDRLRVRLASGAELSGSVFYRGLDAAFATQRDVSRTKRDIKTFEVRLRVDNRARRLAVGMTAYVMLPIAPASLAAL